MLPLSQGSVILANLHIISWFVGLSLSLKMVLTFNIKDEDVIELPLSLYEVYRRKVDCWLDLLLTLQT